MSTGDIVGYAYRAELYCPGCIEPLVIREHDPRGEHRWAWALKYDDTGLEAILDIAASLLHLDRQDETLFDSSKFPKVVYRDMVQVSPPEYTDRCVSCGEVLRS